MHHQRLIGADYDYTYRMANISLSFDVNGAFSEKVVPLTDVAEVTLDASGGNIFTLDATQDSLIDAPTNPVDGQKILIRYTATDFDRTLSLDTGTGGFRFGSDITALTTTSAGTSDYIACVYNLAVNTWDVIQYVKGYISLAIAFDAASHGTASSSSSLVVPHTCSGGLRVLVVGVLDGNSLVTGVTYDSVAMTEADSTNMCDDSSPNTPLRLYYLVAPNLGTHDIVVTSSGSNDTFLAAASYTGASQDTDPFDVTGGSADGVGGVCGGAVSSLTLPLTSTVDRCWMVMVGFNNNLGALAAGSNATLRDSGADGTGIFDSNGTIDPAGALTMEYSGTPGHYWSVGAMLKPAG